ncbi:LOW QUALITY PROTEIN: hypothetical protein OSB04_011930 [Centaurea solstitialis]|uniref:Integrase catalytic domain-containing protein n=1 Tax=Centaurea solstitialis TaxID=347529 RepID=A0AA38WQD8_9ASTR|nr:LOW QUALITY PROTEIN: hypothetical protein OSB04_011930 [Centaurea solstitialis]
MPDIEEKTSDVDKEKSSDLATPGIINYLAIMKILVKLSSSNWAQWSMFTKKGLASVDKAHHMTEQPPDPISREWSIDDSGIQMALWNAMEPQILTIAQNFPTMKEMWDHLSSSFSAKESLSHAYSVVQAYSRAEQGESSFIDYFTRFSKLRDELRTMFPPTTDIKVQEERNNKMDVMMFIAGLSSKYSNARPLLLSNPNATSSVVSTYHLLWEMYGPDTTTTDISAMHTSAEFGHTKWNCPNRPPGSPPPPRPKARIATSGEPADQPPAYTLSEEDYHRLQQLLASQSISPTPRANSAKSGTSSSLDSSWVVDSGATHHMTGNRSILSSLHKAFHPPVSLADGSSCPVQGFGSINNSTNLRLSSILFVPKFPNNFCSVSQITKRNNCCAIFFPTHCLFQELGTNRLIGTGIESRGLYHLSLPSRPTANMCDISIREAHCRLGHPSATVLRQMRPDIPLSSINFHCESCQLGKHTRRPYPPRVSSRVSFSFELVHYDVWGPCPTKSTLGFEYFITFIDDYSRATWNHFNSSIKTLRSDNAKEYFSTDFSSYLKKHGIVHESSCVYTSQQNGVAERKNRHLLDVARTLMFQSHVPKRFWWDAILTAAYLINRMPTPKGYRCYSPSLHRYFTSADVTFHESCPYFLEHSHPVSDPFPDDDIPDSPLVPIIHVSDVHSVPPVSDAPTPATTGLPVEPPPLLFTYAQRGKDQTAEPLDSQPNHESGPSSVPLPMNEPNTPMLATPLQETTIPTTISPTPDVPIYDPPGAPFPDIPIALRKEPRHCTRYPIQNYVAYSHLSSESKAYTSTLDSYPIPRDVRSALAHPGWRQAMEDELGALRGNHTWDLETLPRENVLLAVVGYLLLNYTRIAPYIALKLGYSQAYGIDYDETFSPVAKMSSVRICIALAAIHHWPLHQLDVKNAFLNGVLEEEVYMEQPPGFIVKEEASKVCRLRRSLYGLKQSPRAWFGRFSSVMGEFGMVRSASDYSVFFRHKQGKRIIVVVYVDDIIITGDDEVGITELKQFLQSQFQISDLGRLRYFLGIEVSHSPQGILLSQRKYILDMLTECGLLGCKPVDTLMLPTRKLLPEDGDPMKDPERYRRLVGKLNYLTVTRPDISFTVSVLSQFMAAPYTGHWDAALRGLRYLKTMPGLGILYSDQGHCRVGAFTEEGDGRISGFQMQIGQVVRSLDDLLPDIVYLLEEILCHRRVKNNIRSSAESEYRAMADVTSEMIWVRRLLMELGVFEGGHVAFGDNPKGGKVSGKGKISKGMMTFEDVYYVEQLKYNLLSVSHVCDKKHSILFNDEECLILSPEFKIVDENMILLRAPRKDNVYCLDLEDVSSKSSLNCLLSKASLSESSLWHRRMCHMNFKNMNKLVKGNLVKGLPAKEFSCDDHCVSCLKGKQHKSSHKSKEVNTIFAPLQLLHMDLFGPTNVMSIGKKSYCLVIVDDYSRFTWVFFLGAFGTQTGQDRTEQDRTAQDRCPVFVVAGSSSRKSPDIAEEGGGGRRTSDVAGGSSRRSPDIAGEGGGGRRTSDVAGGSSRRSLVREAEAAGRRRR